MKGKPNDIATMEIQRQLSRCAEFYNWNLMIDEKYPEIITEHIHGDPEEYWDIEVYRKHLTTEQQKIQFHCLMYIVFVNGDIYSLEDLVRMHEEDFKVCLKINWAED